MKIPAVDEQMPKGIYRAVEKRALSTMNLLARWQRRFKLAQTKVKKYKNQAKYYTKRMDELQAETGVVFYVRSQSRGKSRRVCWFARTGAKYLGRMQYKQDEEMQKMPALLSWIGSKLGPSASVQPIDIVLEKRGDAMAKTAAKVLKP